MHQPPVRTVRTRRSRQFFAIGQTRHFGLARDADHRAEIHQRLVEVEDVRRGTSARTRAHRWRFIAWLFGSPVADEHAEQHARDVGVENRRALAEREAADRAGGVGADAFERQQRLFVGRQLAAVARDRFARDRLQPLRPDVVAERIPRRRSLRVSGAAASASSDGYFSSHSAYFGSTRSTCVCCSMISETRMWYGSSVLRHGRSRPWRAYQVSSRCRKRRRSGDGGSDSGVRARLVRPTLSAIPYNFADRENLHANRRQPAKRRSSAARACARTIRASTRTARSTSSTRGSGLVRAVASRRGHRRTRSSRSSAICSRSARSWPIRRRDRRARHQGGRSATPTSSGSKQLIDRLEAELPPLRRFILAGGTPAGAALHVARTVCRRAERRMVALAPPVDPLLIRYVNRLSDLLFVLARVVNQRGGVPETRVVARSRRSMSVARDRASTASKTARASSCETRSRIAPHSTSVVPVDAFRSRRPSGRARSLPADPRNSVGCVAASARECRGDT